MLDTDSEVRICWIQMARSGYVGYRWLGQYMLDTDGEVRICWIHMVRSGLVGYR